MTIPVSYLPMIATLSCLLPSNLGVTILTSPPQVADAAIAAIGVSLSEMTALDSLRELIEGYSAAQGTQRDGSRRQVIAAISADAVAVNRILGIVMRQTAYSCSASVLEASARLMAGALSVSGVGPTRSVTAATKQIVLQIGLSNIPVELPAWVNKVVIRHVENQVTDEDGRPKWKAVKNVIFELEHENRGVLQIVFPGNALGFFRRRRTAAALQSVVRDCSPPEPNGQRVVAARVERK